MFSFFRSRPSGISQALCLDLVAEFNERREQRHARQADAGRRQQQSIEEVKRLAIERAITLVRLDGIGLPPNAGLNHPRFKEEVHKRAASLLFSAHLELSD